MKTETEEINEILKKNLPSHVGEVLKARLDQADKIEIELTNVKKVLGEVQQLEREQNLQLKKYALLDERNAALDKREADILERERNQKVFELTAQLEAAKSNAANSHEYTRGLVRNIDFRKTVFDNENQNGYMNGNAWVQPSPVNKSLNENKTAE